MNNEVEEIRSYLYANQIPCKIDDWHGYIIAEIDKTHKSTHLLCDELMKKIGYRFITLSFWGTKSDGFYSARRYYQRRNS